MKVIVNAKVTPKVIPPGHVYVRIGDDNKVWCLRREENGRSYKYSGPVTRCSFCGIGACKSAKDYPEDPRPWINKWPNDV